ncbi:MAG: hypothetical protein HOP08_09645 [Cyclobacteriaceae bacterium]|nr:hypothetical protein [Cyclobacteriaceae bacterium]
MRKLITFSVFATIVILSLVVRNTVEAQVVTSRVAAGQLSARPICPGPGYAWRNGVWIAPARYAYRHHGGVRLKFHSRPMRYRRYVW